MTKMEVIRLIESRSVEQKIFDLIYAASMSQMEPHFTALGETRDKYPSGVVLRQDGMNTLSLSNDTNEYGVTVKHWTEKLREYILGIEHGSARHEFIERMFELSGHYVMYIVLMDSITEWRYSRPYDGVLGSVYARVNGVLHPFKVHCASGVSGDAVDERGHNVRVDCVADNLPVMTWRIGR